MNSHKIYLITISNASTLQTQNLEIHCLVNGKAFAEKEIFSLIGPQWNATFNGKVEFKISKHFSNNSSYGICLHTGLFMKRPLWSWERNSLQFREDISIDFTIQYFDNSLKFRQQNKVMLQKLISCNLKVINVLNQILALLKNRETKQIFLYNIKCITLLMIYVLFSI